MDAPSSSDDVLALVSQFLDVAGTLSKRVHSLTEIMALAASDMQLIEDAARPYVVLSERTEAAVSSERQLHENMERVPRLLEAVSVQLVLNTSSGLSDMDLQPTERSNAAEYFTHLQEAEQVVAFLRQRGEAAAQVRAQELAEPVRKAYDSVFAVFGRTARNSGVHMDQQIEKQRAIQLQNWAGAHAEAAYAALAQRPFAVVADLAQLPDAAPPATIELLPPATLAVLAEVAPYLARHDEARTVREYVQARSAALTEILPTTQWAPPAEEQRGLFHTGGPAANALVRNLLYVTAVLAFECEAVRAVLPAGCVAPALDAILESFALWLELATAPLVQRLPQHQQELLFVALDYATVLRAVAPAWLRAMAPAPDKQQRLVELWGRLAVALRAALDCSPLYIVPSGQPPAGCSIHPSATSLIAAASRMLRWRGVINVVLGQRHAPPAALFATDGETDASLDAEAALPPDESLHIAPALRAPTGQLTRCSVDGFVGLLRCLISSMLSVLEHLAGPLNLTVQQVFHVNNTSHLLLALQSMPLAPYCASVRAVVMQRLDRQSQAYIDATWAPITRTLRHDRLQLLLANDRLREDELARRLRALIRQDMADFTQQLDAVCQRHDARLKFSDPSLRSALRQRAAQLVVVDNYAPYIALCADVEEAAAALNEYAVYTPNTALQLIQIAFDGNSAAA